MSLFHFGFSTLILHASSTREYKIFTTYVETFNNDTADIYPKRFLIKDSWLGVMDIEDRWYGTGSAYYKVFADDARRYILKHDTDNGTWSVEQI